MKSLIICILAMLFLGLSVSRTAAQTETDTFKVWGNCEMCKHRIEKAAKKAGADKANWNQKTKMLVVTYDTTQTTNDDIQKKIASAGHDTEKYSADDKAYHSLDECCHYKRKNAQ